MKSFLEEFTTKEKKTIKIIFMVLLALIVIFLVLETRYVETENGRVFDRLLGDIFSGRW